MKLSAHPLAELVPSMTNAEYIALRDDIDENGQREPLTLYEGKILDGQHRYRACQELGLEPKTTDYEGDAPASAVVSLNVRRRQLTPAQLAAVATDLAPALAGEAEARMKAGKKDPSANGREGKTADLAAAQVGASGRSVERTNKLKSEAPEQFEKVKRGESSIKGALEAAGLTTDGGGETASPKDKFYEVLDPGTVREIKKLRRFNCMNLPRKEAAKREKAVSALIESLEELRTNLAVKAERVRI